MKVIDFMLSRNTWQYYDFYYNGKVITRHCKKVSAREIMLGSDNRREIVNLAVYGDVAFYDEKKKLIGIKRMSRSYEMQLLTAS